MKEFEDFCHREYAEVFLDVLGGKNTMKKNVDLLKKRLLKKYQLVQYQNFQMSSHLKYGKLFIFPT